MNKIADRLADFFQPSSIEIVYTIILAAIFTFFSTISYLKTVNDEFSNVTFVYYGFPVATLKTEITMRQAAMPLRYKIVLGWVIERNVEIVFLGLAANFAFYALISFIFVKILSWIRDEMAYRKFYGTH